MDASMMAGAQNPQPQISPEGGVGGVDPNKLKDAIRMLVEQSVNQQGYVDLEKAIQMWPQVSQQLGINIPLETLIQMIQKDPSLIENIVQQMGLAGIIYKGKILESGADAAGGGASPVGGNPQGGLAGTGAGGG